MFLFFPRSKGRRKSHFPGPTLYHQKDDEAEVLRQAVNRQDQKYDKDHKDTLYSKHRLGVTLYNQKMYDEAEGMLRQVVSEQELKLGKDHKDTLQQVLARMHT
jgi:hypothetical protein